MEYYFYKKLTLTIKLNKIGKGIYVVFQLLTLEKKTFNVKKQETDKERRILILDVSDNDFEYILINLCNGNTKKEQINVFSNTLALLKKCDIN